MLIKSMRYEIVKPTDVTWDEFGRVLNELRYSSARIANYTVQLLWQWDNYKYEYKEKNGEYPPITEKPNLYKIIRAKFPDVGVDIIGQTSRWVENRYSSIRKDMFMLRKSVLSFKDNMPIFFNNQSYKVFNDGNDYIFDVRLQTKLAEGSIRYCFLVKTGENLKRAILDKLISEQYKKSMLQIVRDSKKKWYVILSYGYEPIKLGHEYVNDRIMEVTLGDSVDKAISIHIRKTMYERVIPFYDIEHSMSKFYVRFNQIKYHKKYHSEGYEGHGSKKFLKPLQELQDKISSYKNTANHKYSRIIVDEAIKRKCSVIKVSGDSFFVDWPVSDFSNKIKYKAEESGIRFIQKETNEDLNIYEADLAAYRREVP
jgi:hypothetical protein